MAITLTPPPILRQTVHLPASKSISNRALLIDALCRHGHSETGCKTDRLHNLSDCDDTRAMQQALTTATGSIDIGAAGTAMRFMTAYLAVTPGTRIITGSERMQHRPIGVLVEALRQLGAHIEYVGQEGFPPLRITGMGSEEGSQDRLSVQGDVSSQYISALLMIGPVLAGGLTLRLAGRIVSRPYIEMTLSVMRAFGAKAEWTDKQTICVQPGGYCPTAYRIENDWSAASYWYEMVALSKDEQAEVLLPGLYRQSLQGDSAVAEMFSPLGVLTEHTTDTEGHEAIRLTRGPRTDVQLHIDFQHQPDLAQTFVVTSAMLGIPFHFTGLQSLKIKETDRILALCTELHKLGYAVTDEGEGTLGWYGERCPEEEAPAIDTYEDHRMAMAFAPAAMVRGRLCIRHPEVVSKSYPTFWEHLSAAGFGLAQNPDS